jgi:hypothetical protein
MPVCTHTRSQTQIHTKIHQKNSHTCVFKFRYAKHSQSFTDTRTYVRAIFGMQSVHKNKHTKKLHTCERILRYAKSTQNKHTKQTHMCAQYRYTKRENINTPTHAHMCAHISCAHLEVECKCARGHHRHRQCIRKGRNRNPASIYL